MPTDGGYFTGTESTRRSRIQKAFERRFRELLGELGARDREKGIQWLFGRAEVLTDHAKMAPSQALTELNIALVEKVHRFLRRKNVSDWPSDNSPRVICDAGLGALARWLRAVGCEAYWVQDITDCKLVAEAEQLRATIITTDSFLADRRPIANGTVRAIWVPPTLTRHEQLRLVRAELDLTGGPPRCMRCGGELLPVEKEAVKDRIPPKTYLWVNEYFQCDRCHQLFWRGTHWQRVWSQLEAGKQ
jgi:uncharacterized protein